MKNVTFKETFTVRPSVLLDRQNVRSTVTCKPDFVRGWCFPVLYGSWWWPVLQNPFLPVFEDVFFFFIIIIHSFIEDKDIFWWVLHVYCRNVFSVASEPERLHPATRFCGFHQREADLDIVIFVTKTAHLELVIIGSKT